MAGELNKLSDKRLKNLLGTKQEKYTYFADGAGLGIRVSPAGGISWVFTYRLNDPKLHKLTLGNYPAMSLKDARESRDKCKKWLAAGKDPKMQFNLTMSESLKPVTVREAIEYWIEQYAVDNRENIKQHRLQLEKHIFPYIGDMALSDCETRYWLQCFDRVRKTAPVSSGYLLQMCKQALKFCRVRRFAVSDALDDLTIADVGKKQNKRSRVLTDKELADLVTYTESNDMNPYYLNMIKLLLIFGARTQEIRLSKWNEWDLENGIWTVPESHSKTDTKIIRPIPKIAQDIITELKKQNGKSEYILGSLKSTVNVSQTGRKIYSRMNHLEPWTLHDLRRTFSTGMNNLGISPHIVELLLGHSLPSVMSIYNRSLYLPEKLDALNKWIERLYLLAGKHENVVLLQKNRVI